MYRIHENGEYLATTDKPACYLPRELSPREAAHVAKVLQGMLVGEIYTFPFVDDTKWLTITRVD